MVRLAARTARSSTPRTRRRSTRTSSTSTSTARRCPSIWYAHARHVPALVRPRREDVPRRQPAHQAVPVLGVGDRRGADAAPRRDLPRRGLHPAEGDEAAGQGRLHAVLLLLHLAQHEGRADRVPDRADHEECRAYMRPNFFVNTPDINPIFLQTSGRAGFRTRLLLAATLGGNYGIYSGFELCEAAPVPGKEEYLNSEKYEIRAWDLDQPGQHQGRHPPGQRAAPRAPGAAGLPEPRLLQRLRTPHPLLRQAHRRPLGLPALRRQPRPA